MRGGLPAVDGSHSEPGRRWHHTHRPWPTHPKTPLHFRTQATRSASSATPSCSPPRVSCQTWTAGPATSASTAPACTSGSAPAASLPALTARAPGRTAGVGKRECCTTPWLDAGVECMQAVTAPGTRGEGTGLWMPGLQAPRHGGRPAETQRNSRPMGACACELTRLSCPWPCDQCNTAPGMTSRVSIAHLTRPLAGRQGLPGGVLAVVATGLRGSPA